MDEIKSWNISSFMNHFSSREYIKKNLINDYENIKNEIPEEIISALKEIIFFLPKKVDSDKSSFSIESKENNKNMTSRIYSGDQRLDDFCNSKNINKNENSSLVINEEKNSLRTSSNEFTNYQKHLTDNADSKFDISSLLVAVKEIAVDVEKKDISLISRDNFKLQIPIVPLDGAEKKGIIYGFRSWGSDHSVTISSQFSGIGKQVVLHPSTSLVEQRLIQHTSTLGENSFSVFKCSDQDDGKQKHKLYKEEDEL